MLHVSQTRGHECKSPHCYRRLYTCLRVSGSRLAFAAIVSWTSYMHPVLIIWILHWCVFREAKGSMDREKLREGVMRLGKSISGGCGGHRVSWHAVHIPSPPVLSYVPFTVRALWEEKGSHVAPKYSTLVQEFICEDDFYHMELTMMSAPLLDLFLVQVFIKDNIFKSVCSSSSD